MPETTESFTPVSFSFDPLEQPPDLSIPVADRLAQAEEILAAARAEAEEIRRQAHEQGLLEGRQEGQRMGREEALAALEPASTALGAATLQLQDTIATLAEQTEGAAIDLGLRIAEQALGAALEIEPRRVLDVTKGALRRLVERGRVLVLVNPDDLDLVRAGIGQIVGELGGIDHCEVQAERRVARGGAIVQTEEGEVDAMLQTKLARAREAIAHELNDR
jgi:flagellar biosynthesis/type III secretory pathway protein FliH